jgi:FkbM family methyltransferase
LAEDLTSWQRFSHLRSTIANWPLVVPDKLGLLELCRYRTTSGLTVWCRGRSTDVNEAVAVLSGFEYPPQLLQLNPGAVAFDLGANIGSFVLYLAALNRGVAFRGVAFEPYAPNFAMLQRNLNANDIDTFTTVEAAVTGSDGLVTLSEESEPDRVHVTEQGGGATVRSCRLSHYCADNGISSIDLLKLDVEGSEYDIIESDYDFVKGAVDNVLIEYHELDGKIGATLVERLEADFTVTVVHERSRTGVIYARNKSSS